MGKLHQKQHSLIPPSEVDNKAYTTPFGLVINKGKKQPKASSKLL